MKYNFLYLIVFSLMLFAEDNNDFFSISILDKNNAWKNAQKTTKHLYFDCKNKKNCEDDLNMALTNYSTITILVTDKDITYVDKNITDYFRKIFNIVDDRSIGLITKYGIANDDKYKVIFTKYIPSCEIEYDKLPLIVFHIKGSNSCTKFHYQSPNELVYILDFLYKQIKQYQNINQLSIDWKKINQDFKKFLEKSNEAIKEAFKIDIVALFEIIKDVFNTISHTSLR